MLFLHFLYESVGMPNSAFMIRCGQAGPEYGLPVAVIKINKKTLEALFQGVLTRLYHYLFFLNRIYPILP